MATAEVTVMGAGVFGLSIAFACLRRGASVQVIDPNGVATGASGGIVGALAPHVPEQWNSKKQFQFESLLMAKAFWGDVADISGDDPGYVRSGRVQPVMDATGLALAQQRALTAVTHWGDAAAWNVEPATGADWEPTSPVGSVVRDSLSGLIHPRQATLALAKAVQTLGGAILTDGSPQGRIIWATGWAGLQEMTAQHTRQIGTGVKGQAALIQFDAAGAPQLFADTLHIIPHLDGTVAIGGTTERTFDHPTQTDDALEQLLTRAFAAMPVLANAPIIERWAGVRPRSRSRAPMLGEHPYRAGEFVANGGFKIGFGMAPKVGEVMADLILDQRVTYPPEFDAARSL